MRVFLVALLLASNAALSVPAIAQTPGPPANAPSYTADTIVNSAADAPGWFAPNSFVAIFGSNLAFTTRAMASSDTAGGILPTVLPGTNVSVVVNGLFAYVYYVSPSMVIVLLPAGLSAGPATLQLELDGIAGPAVSIMLSAAAPVVVTQNEISAAGLATVYALHGDLTEVTASSPAKAGETIFLFASGLGQTNPPQVSGQVPPYASQLQNPGGFSVLLNGAPLAQGAVSYAGILPGNAGVYEIVATLPSPLPQNPQVQVSVAGVTSLARKVLNTQ